MPHAAVGLMPTKLPKGFVNCNRKVAHRRNRERYGPERGARAGDHDADGKDRGAKKQDHTPNGQRHGGNEGDRGANGNDKTSNGKNRGAKEEDRGTVDPDCAAKEQDRALNEEDRAPNGEDRAANEGDRRAIGRSREKIFAAAQVAPRGRRRKECHHTGVTSQQAIDPSVRTGRRSSIMDTVPPRTDAGCADWAANYDTQITATPTAFGLVAADATAFHALVTDYDSRLATVGNPTTRNKVTLAQKNASKAALIAKARELIRKNEAFPALTNAQRAQLRLRVRDVSPTPQPPPGTAPLGTLEPTGVLTLVDSATPHRKGKPVNVKGAVITGVVQPASAPAPTEPDGLPFIALVTRGRTALPLPPDADTKKFYVFARWFNERGELGPASPVAVTTIAA